MIKLDSNEKKLILLCKRNYSDNYPWTGSFVETLKPLFTEIYGWNPDEDNNYHDYLKCIFNKLLDIYLKIDVDYSNRNLKELFHVSFYKGIYFDEELPIERSIHKLCSLIQNTRVIDDNKNKIYDLDNK